MSFPEQTVTALFQLFEKKYFSYHYEGKFYFKNATANTFKKFLIQLGSPECFNLPELAIIGFSILSKTFNDEDFMQVVNEYSRKNLPENKLPKIGISKGEIDLGQYIRSLVAVVNVTPNTKEKVLILDPNNRFQRIDIDPEVYFLAMGVDMNKFLRNPSTEFAILDFNPFSTEPYYIKSSYLNGLPIKHINTYMPPMWRQKTGITGQFRGFIKTVFEHLFPVRDELEYVLDWFHHSLVSRCETILCLIGARGTGKGVVCSSIMEALHGTNYFQIAKQEVLTDKFNGEFKSKRYVFFDEVDVSGERELAKFKAFANNKIAMEKKGEDSQTIDNFASMAISSNYKNKFKVEAQERRFSVPTVTSTPLNNLYTEDEIGDFILRINDPDNDEIAEFGHFLLNRVPKYSAQTPLKGDYFMELCRLSMVEWKLFILEYLLENGEPDKPLLLKEMRRAFKRAFKEDTIFPSKQSAFETFLDDYKHNGKYKIGEYVRVKDENHRVCPAIMPNTEFITLFGYLTNPEQKDALDSL